MNIMELEPEALSAWLKDQGLDSYRKGQLLRWIYQRQTDRFELMTDLGKAFRAKLTECFIIDRLETVNVEKSKDGSRKYLMRLKDGNTIESVLIPEKKHSTLCISSQVGCSLGCRFCLTTREGLIRNLSAGEIVSQVRDILKDTDESSPLTNIVLMGMGEPLANYQNVVRALNIITNSDFGLGFSGRRITLSTAGILPGLRRLGQDTSVNLAVSLNATDNPTRDWLMPVNKTYPLEKLMQACREYPLKPRKRITFEYILIRGINDTEQDARRLVHLLSTLKSKINLIPFNEHEGSDFKRPGEDTILRFQNILLKKHFTVMIRRSKGEDISAACGQLKARTRA